VRPCYLPSSMIPFILDGVERRIISTSP